MLPLRLRHGVQDLVAELQSPVKVQFYPAGRLLDGSPLLVVLAPTLDKGQSKNAKAAEVVHADTD